MNSSVFSLCSFLLLVPILSLILVPSHVNCFKTDVRLGSCQPFDCGKLKGISYPFRGNHQPDSCGHPEFVLDCQSDDAHLVFDGMSQRFRVLELDQTARTLNLAITDLSDSTCPDKFSNISLESTPFSFTAKDQMAALLYDCDQTKHPGQTRFSCDRSNFSRSGYFMMEADLGYEFPPRLSCGVTVLVPVMEKAVGKLMSKEVDVEEVLDEGFEVSWSSIEEEKCRDCIVSGGKCGRNTTVYEFSCFCPDYKAYAWSCSSSTTGTTQDMVPASDPVYPAPSDAAGDSSVIA
ncbi:Wall-associated receptor kinase, C-terminal [Trema orientale]|uniref:non-specific serine/threonine protein kinase n=1 Tax=Trema orientale TaxID=63057 RepID=A0A2P5FVS6_TREOI|nr:Wall-associated receptor kinase, C-terminal [Trema orientale]